MMRSFAERNIRRHLLMTGRNVPFELLLTNVMIESMEVPCFLWIGVARVGGCSYLFLP